MKKSLKRSLSLVLVVCLCLTMMPVVTMQAEAAGYYSENDLGNIKCSILSNSGRASYVNAMMKYHILSSTDDYRVARNLENGSSVVFFFDGCSDNVDDATYGNYTKYHLSAYCAVVQKVNGVLKIVYESENCSTIPDNPRNVSLNGGDAVPTVLDGVYNIISTNHLSRYASLRIANNSGVAPVIRCTSSSSYISTSSGINIHARSEFSNAPTNGISSTSYSSTGCFNVGLINNTWSEYNKFINAILGISNAIITTPYSSGSWTKCTSGYDKGVVVVDRSQYKTQLAAIYGGDNSYSASTLVSKITAYTDNLDYSAHTTHTYSSTNYEAAHPHKVYEVCSCGAWRYTGATKTLSSCTTCNPVSTSTTYNAVLPFKAYLKGTSTVYPYTTEQLATTSGGEIWSTDECTISAVYSNGACKVTYPAGSTNKTAYTSLSNFVGNTSASLVKQTVNREIKTYIRATTGSTQYGYTEPGDIIYKLGTSGNMTQIFYPTSSGYKLAWVVTSELTEPTYDTRFNPYCGIKGYPCVSSNFNVYEADHSTYKGLIYAHDSDLYQSDYCTINAVYADGWCQVTYPISGGTKTGYTQLSNFVYNVSFNHVKYTANAKTTVYATKNLSTDPGWHIGAGDVFYVVSTYNSASQVLYPIDAQYGGGYKLGWIYTSALPKTTYTVSYNANGGTGAPSNQTKTHGVTLKLSTTVPTRTGYAFVGWATSSSATSATYAAGANYSTDANLSLYAVWTLNKYEISYNANGGTNAPATQNKAHGTNLTLTTAVPTKNYSITFNANGGSVDAATRQVACKFLGWATSSSASTATYQPGSTFTTNANTTLYAVWENPTLGQYSIPTRAGYVFDGWYTAASGGTQVTLSTVISANMTVYAHWVVATYTIGYDANGGLNTPSPQAKTHGQSLTLSTTVPTREGYIFVGWGTEEDHTTVQYQPGDTYSVDYDILLMAVWEEAALTGIELLTGPAKTSYYVGDTLDTAGLSLKATYSDGSTKVVSDGFTCSPTVLNSVGTQTITVSYNGKTATFAVTVRELPNGAMEVGNVSGESGETVTVPVRITDNPGIVAARLKIAYDSTVMMLTEVKDGGILGEYVFGGDLNANPYVVMWENGLATSDYTQTGTLVYLTFQIAESATVGDYPITVSYNAEEVYNKELINTAFAIKQGVVTVEEKEIITPDSPQIVVDSKIAHCGNTISVGVKLLNNPGFSVLNVAFLYDNEYLTLTSVENKATSMVMTHNASILWDSATNYTADGVLATLNFTVAENAPEGDYEIRVVFMGASNEKFEEVKMVGVSGVLTVTSVVYGDANGDGQVTTVDLAMLRKYLSSMDPISGTSSIVVKAGADCNGDGKVNTIDLAMLRKYLSSKDPITGESSVIMGPK